MLPLLVLASGCWMSKENGKLADTYFWVQQPQGIRRTFNRTRSGNIAISLASCSETGSGTYTSCTWESRSSRVFSAVSIRLNFCTFNRINSGTGAGCIDLRDSNTLYATECTFTECSAGCGSAIYLRTVSASASVTNCTAIRCTASMDGSFLNSNGEAILTNCRILSCTASIRGGALVAYDIEAKLTVSNSIFHNCSCPVSSGSDTYYGYGGSIFCNMGKLDVMNSQFEQCSGWRGGTIGYGAAASSSISDCIISGSKSTEFGGGVYFNGGSSATLRFTNVKCYLCSGSRGSALYIGTAKSLEWGNICILHCGSAPIYSSSVAVPTAAELIEGCPTIEFNRVVGRRSTMRLHAEFCNYYVLITVI